MNYELNTETDARLKFSTSFLGTKTSSSIP
jgi:hypothetical protein